MRRSLPGMRRLIAGITFMLALAGHLSAQSRNNHAGALGQLSKQLQDLSAKLSPSVVQIVGMGYGIEDDSQHSGSSVLARQRNTGSGVILAADGYIMTNAHVVDGARKLRVKVGQSPDGRSHLFDATLVGLDRLLDLALLKIDAKGLQPLPFADSLGLKQGELVLAFGSPLGMDDSVSMGVVSAPA